MIKAADDAFIKAVHQAVWDLGHLDEGDPSVIRTAEALVDDRTKRFRKDHAEHTERHIHRVAVEVLARLLREYGPAKVNLDSDVCLQSDVLLAVLGLDK